jgi:hypothetical protein
MPSSQALQRAVRAVPVPDHSLLAELRSRGDAYADAFCCEVADKVALPAYVEAFYTSWLFRLERWVLAALGMRSTDAQARQLALGERDRFAAWKVGGRRDQELLMAETRGPTCSWFMVAPMQVDGGKVATRLYFGTAIRGRGVQKDAATGEPTLGPPHSTLLGLHLAYSQRLLAAAATRAAALG